MLEGGREKCGYRVGIFTAKFALNESFKNFNTNPPPPIPTLYYWRLPQFTIFFQIFSPKHLLRTPYFKP